MLPVYFKWSFEQLFRTNWDFWIFFNGNLTTACYSLESFKSFMEEVFSLSLNLTQVHSWSTVKFENKILRSLWAHLWNSLPENINKHYVYKLATCNSKILWKSGQVLHVNAIFTTVNNLLQSLIGIMWCLISP